LLSLASENEGISAEILKSNNISLLSIKNYLNDNIQDDNKVLPNSDKSKTSSTPTLDMYTRNISHLANSGDIDPIIGRDDEISRIAQILSRRKKNNPVLIGEPGVGKTAVVEGLALRINSRLVPRILWNKKILALDLASLIGGTKYRGQFEERMKNLLQELESNDQLIIFIDEMHTIVGAGGATGSLDAANIFKPALARGDIHVIGATTLNEYRKFVEVDGALERRFQKVSIYPPSKSETKKILHGIKEKYEKHHKVIYSDESIEACVEYSDKYISDKYLPDKAIDVLDEVGSAIHLNSIDTPLHIVKIEDRIKSLNKKKNVSISKQKFENAAILRDKEKKLIAQLKKEQDDWMYNDRRKHPTITSDNVADIVSMITGIPISRLAESESQRLLNIDNELKRYIIGQDHAIELIKKAILRSRAGFKNTKKPIGSFLFLGPTGVGKTELAKVLSNYLFTNDESFIKIDMSEYMERFNVARLIGSPPGYVGYDEGGQLTEQVRRNPYSVVLFDEIEKAHRDVYNLLLQILDEGTLTDSFGRKIDFKNTIIIMTSNLGSQAMTSTNFGFNSKDDKHASKKTDIMSEVSRFFRPEFLNRIDNIITFNPLSRDNLYSIINIQLEELRNTLQEKNCSITLTPTAKKYLLSDGSHRKWGARYLTRLIQSEIIDKISLLFLENKLGINNTITVKSDKDKLIFTKKRKKSINKPAKTDI
jgi:ATP-dependent Clp protease ATP-binding subunit ClpC